MYFHSQPGIIYPCLAAVSVSCSVLKQPLPNGGAFHSEDYCDIFQNILAKLCGNSNPVQSLRIQRHLTVSWTYHFAPPNICIFSVQLCIDVYWVPDFIICQSSARQPLSPGAYPGSSRAWPPVSRSGERTSIRLSWGLPARSRNTVSFALISESEI